MFLCALDSFQQQKACTVNMCHHFLHSSQTQQQKMTRLRDCLAQSIPKPCTEGLWPSAQHIWNFKETFWVPQEMGDIDKLRSSYTGSYRCPRDGSGGHYGKKWRKMIVSLRKRLQWATIFSQPLSKSQPLEQEAPLL